MTHARPQLFTRHIVQIMNQPLLVCVWGSKPTFSILENTESNKRGE